MWDPVKLFEFLQKNLKYGTTAVFLWVMSCLDNNFSRPPEIKSGLDSDGLKDCRKRKRDKLMSQLSGWCGQLRNWVNFLINDMKCIFVSKLLAIYKSFSPKFIFHSIAFVKNKSSSLDSLKMKFAVLNNFISSSLFLWEFNFACQIRTRNLKIFIFVLIRTASTSALKRCQ